MSQSKNCGGDEQVLLLPFMAEGHIIPFVALATLLQQRTPHTITLITTPLNVQHLHSSLPPDTPLRLASLPFSPSDHGLPPGADNTRSLPPHLFLPLIQASSSLAPSLRRLISSLPRPPLCLISDEFMSWSVHTSRSLRISHAVFHTSSAFSTAVFAYVWTLLPHRQTSADEFPLPDLPHVCVRRSDLSDACLRSDGTDPWAILFRSHIDCAALSDGVLINTVEDLEPQAFQHLRKNHWRNLWAIGPVLRSMSSPSNSGVSVQRCTEWLDLHSPSSVLYISFGSQNSINPQQMMELAKGLELSGYPFVWVIRPPVGFNADAEFSSEWLPEGFEDWVTEKQQGILVRRWAPQMEILSHQSTGGFLSHCGWNSVLESLSCGVPIIGWPMDAEQPYNMKLLKEELGVGVQLARGNKVEIKWDDVVRLVKLVMDGECEEGRELRRRAKQLEEIIKAAVVEEEGRKGSSVRAIEDFIQTALTRKENC